MIVVVFCLWTDGLTGGGAPHDSGVGRTRPDGSPAVLSSGNRSSRAMISACSPNEVNVVQLRRVRCAHEVSSMLSANIVSSSEKSVCWYGHHEGLPQTMSTERKKAAFSRGLLELSGHHRCPVDDLLRWLSRLGRRGLRGSSAGRRLRNGRLSGSRRRWRGHARLHVVSVDDCFGDVDCLAPPEHIALRPRLGSIHDHAEAVVLRILHDHRSHLLKDAARNLLLLAAELFLGILHGAIKELLLAFDLLLQGGERILIQLALLRGHLLLQAFEFVVLALQLSLLGVELLLQSLEIAAAFVAAENGFGYVDGSDFRTGARASCSRRRRRIRARRRSGRCCGAAGLGQCGKRERNRNGQKNSQKLAFHWIG